MAIQNVSVHSYRAQFGGTEEAHQTWNRVLSTMTRQELNDAIFRHVNYYQLDGEEHSLWAGEKDYKLNIYVNATFKNDNHSMEVETLSTPLIVDGKDTGVMNLLKPGLSNTVKIKNEEGQIIAEYSRAREEMNILFDLASNEATPSTVDVFKYIIKALNEQVFKVRALENSWVHSKDKGALIERFKERSSRVEQREIDNDRRQVDEHEENIKAYTRNIGNLHRQLIVHRRNLANSIDRSGSIGERLIKDMDLVAELDKVADLEVKDDFINVTTHPLYMYDNNSDDRYLLGKIKMTIDMNESDVRFFNEENARRSYWTSNDPHPHVDGNRGEACLGNVAPTIAELSAQNEIYALVLTAIDFLENANTDDPAGENVRNWDMVDEEGNIIQNGRNNYNDDNTATCDCCEEGVHEDTLCTVFGDTDGTDSLDDEHSVCEYCLDERYRYSEHYDEYLHVDANNPEGEDE